MGGQRRRSGAMMWPGSNVDYLGTNITWVEVRIGVTKFGVVAQFKI